MGQVLLKATLCAREMINLFAHAPEPLLTSILSFLRYQRKCRRKAKQNLVEVFNQELKAASRQERHR